jgi:GNAT superfamily N-acetyltransferase
MPTVEVTITYLEMEHPAMFRPAEAAPGDVTLERLDPADAEVAEQFYNDVGNDYFWLERAKWGADKWRDELETPGTEFWILSHDEEEAGFFLLTEPQPRTSEILYLGLLPGFEGRGLGGHLLSCAIERAWATGADRVLVNTCTLDHPAALPNYLARGFEVVRKRTELRVLPE